MSEFFLQSIDVLLWIFELKLHFFTDSVGELVEIDSDEIEDLFFIDFVGHFHFIIFIIECLVQVYLIVVPFSLFVGQVIDIYTHWQQFLTLQLHYFLRVSLLHFLEELNRMELLFDFLVRLFQNFSIQLIVFLVLMNGNLFLEFGRQDTEETIAYLSLSDQRRNVVDFELSSC